MNTSVIYSNELYKNHQCRSDFAVFRVCFLADLQIVFEFDWSFTMLIFAMFYAGIMTLNVTWNAWIFVKYKTHNNLWMIQDIHKKDLLLNSNPFNLRLADFTIVPKERVSDMRRTKRRTCLQQNMFFSGWFFFSLVNCVMFWNLFWNVILNCIYVCIMKLKM